MWGNRGLVGALLLLGLVAALIGGWSEWVDRTDWLSLVQGMGATLVGLSWAAIGGVLTWLRPRNAVGWLMLVVGVLTQVGLSGAAFARSGGFGWLGRPDAWTDRPAGLAISLIGGFAIYVMIGLLPVLYPTGALPSKAWRWPSIAVIAGAGLMQAQWLLEQLEPVSGPTILPILPILVYAGGILVIWVLSVVRLVTARSPERQQLVWLFAAVVGLILTQSLGSSPEALWIQLPFLYLLPVAIAIGILKYRLLGIEAVLRRGLVYGLLTVAIFVLYAAVSIAAGIQLSGATLPAVIAAGLVAVGLAPLSSWLQRLVDRLLYGHRSDPIRAVADLGGQVAGAGEAELLDVVLRGVANSVKSRGARIHAEDGRLLARVGERFDAAAFAADLTVGKTAVGSLELAGRGPGERYSAQDKRMLRAMIPQLAVVVRALQLTGELQEQRDAVVNATRSERDRLRRDLHDGLGPSLTGVGLGLQALADALSAGDQNRAMTITEVLRTEMARSVTEVRQILVGLGPAALADQNLGEAIRRQVASSSSPIPIAVQIGHLPPLAADAQEAVYRVVGEAVTNALKHAEAAKIVVEVTQIGAELVVRIADDGNGFPEKPGRGIGLESMRERASSVGGRFSVDSGRDGTTVELAIPIGVSVNG